MSNALMGRIIERTDLTEYVYSSRENGGQIVLISIFSIRTFTL